MQHATAAWLQCSKKSCKCIEVASKQAYVRASLKNCIYPRVCNGVCVSKRVAKPLLEPYVHNIQRRNPYNEHFCSHRTGFRLRRCSLCSSCPFFILCRVREAKGCLIDTWPKRKVKSNPGSSKEIRIWDLVNYRCATTIQNKRKTKCSINRHNFSLSTVTPEK